MRPPWSQMRFQEIHREIQHSISPEQEEQENRSSETKTPITPVSQHPARKLKKKNPFHAAGQIDFQDARKKESKN